MDIHHDGSPLVVSARRPDVQGQAVLAGLPSIDGGSIPEACALERSWPELCCIEHTRPGVEWLRREKPTVTDWGMREWNALPDGDGPLFKALYLSSVCF